MKTTFFKTDTPDTTTSFDLQSVDKGHHNTTYRGVKCIKCPFDYVMYQMIISEVQPDLIIEIGTNEGGSALYFADLLATLGKGEIHTIDIENRIDPLAKAHDRITSFHDGWAAYDLSQVAKYKVVLVIEDSSHTYENTLAAIKRFAPVVTTGSYLIVEDGIVDALGISAQFGGGPVKAIKEFLKKESQFVVDTKWCDFFGKNATFNTIGYLKKIK